MVEDKTITLSKKQFDSLMSRLDAVESGRTYKKPQRVKDHVASLRLHEGKPVIGYGIAEETFNKTLNKRQLILPIIMKDEEKSVDYLQFLNEAQKVQVRILKQTAIERVESSGIAPKHDQLTDKLTGDEIDMTVTTISYDVDIEITEGELKGTTLTVPSTALNV